MCRRGVCQYNRWRHRVRRQPGGPRPASCHSGVSMVSNQVLGARVTAGLLALSATLSGCSWMHSRESEPVAPPPPVAASAETSGAGEHDLTATEAAIQGAPANEVTSSGPPPDASIINPNAPK